MSRPTRIAFLSIALALVLFPSVIAKPGQPMNLRSDEPAYYLMALSLAHDGDLRCELEDIRRLSIEYPYNLVNNLILMSADGWKTVYFGKPWLVSLIAAPATRLAGSDGFFATNMALLMLSIWLGALYLRQWNPEWLALLFSGGFFVFSNAWAYVFWMHTEVLCIAAATACLYLALTPAPEGPPTGRLERWLRRFWNASTRPFFSGAALVFAAYNKPILALLGAAALVAVQRRDGWRRAAAWVAGAAITGAAVCGLSLALTPTATAYLGAERQGVRVESFDRMPDLPEPTGKDIYGGERNTWWWILRKPDIDRQLPPNLGYFFVGRHTGLFLYAPFTLLCLILFLAFGRRSAVRWTIVASLAGVALFFLTLIPFNWHGGGGFVGNRYFVNALPGFLFLVTRIAPAWLPAVGYALGGLFVGSLVFAPYGSIVPSPTLQAHTRNAPFQFFPFEKTIRKQIPGYRGYNGGDAFFFGRSDLFRPVGDALWLAGGKPVVLQVRTAEPLRRPVFQVRTITAPNRVTIRLDGSEKEPHFQTLEPPGNITRIALEPRAPRAGRDWDDTVYYDYELTVDAEQQAWHYELISTRNRRATRDAQAAASEATAHGGREVEGWEEEELEMLVGAIVTYLGEEEELDWDVYSYAWVQVPEPGPIAPGATVQFRGRVRNTSQHPWRARGATRVAFSYHLLRPDGSTVEWDGLRAMLPADVPPGAETDLVFEIEAPRQPGSYLLDFDAVREQVAWFSDRREGLTARRPLEVARPGS